MTRADVAAWLVAACLLPACGRSLPSALSLSDPTAEAPSDRPSTRQDALARIVGGDPLVRRVRLPEADTLEDIPDTEVLQEAIREVRRLESRQLDVLQGLRTLADRRRGTETMPLVRGYRLGLAERLLATNPGPAHQAALHDLGALLSDLLPAVASSERLRNPLGFLEADGGFAEPVQRYGERWVLEGWLDGPDIPLEGVADALDGTAWDGLRETALGRLIQARARGATGPLEPGLDALRDATGLALQRAAADRNHEQAAWSDARRAAAERLGADDPVDALLSASIPPLVAAAADERAAGAALLAIEARRLGGACDRPPCAGLDRVGTIARAGDWHPDVEAFAATWRAIALKEAVDAMEVGHDTVVFRRALVDLVDALLGTGATPMPASLLGRRMPEPAVWSMLGASVGAPTAGSWDELRVPLGAHLADAARLARRNADPAWHDALDRIARRAVP